MSRPQQQQNLARQAGFESYLGLMESSTPIATADDSRWYVCPVQRGWGVWSDTDLQLIAGFPSVAAAQDHVRTRTGTATASDRAAAEAAGRGVDAAEIDPLAAGAEMKPPLP